MAKLYALPRPGEPIFFAPPWHDFGVRRRKFAETLRMNQKKNDISLSMTRDGVMKIWIKKKSYFRRNKNMDKYLFT
jgi:hypothetical protein